MVSFFFWVLLLVVLGAGVLALGFAFLNYNQVMDVEIDAEHKKAHHEKQFPLDLEKARQMGTELVRLA